MLFWTVVVFYGLGSLVAFVAYGLDKSAATNGRWRIPERRLHWFEFLGGWPGALVAQGLFRHKRRKTSFMIVFAGIVLLHLTAWLAWWRYLS